MGSEVCIATEQVISTYTCSADRAFLGSAPHTQLCFNLSLGSDQRLMHHNAHVRLLKGTRNCFLVVFKHECYEPYGFVHGQQLDDTRSLVAPILGFKSTAAVSRQYIRWLSSIPLGYFHGTPFVGFSLQ